MAQFCDLCGDHWQSCVEYPVGSSGSRAKSRRGQESYYRDQGDPPWQQDTWTASPRQSPRYQSNRRTKQKKNWKGDGKGQGDQANASKSQGQQPLAPPPPPPLTSNQQVPWMNMPTPPGSTPTLISAEEQRRIEVEQKYQTLIGQLNKHTGQLPADIETVVHEEKKKGKQDNKKQLHSAVTVLDKAQMKMDRAVNARNNLLASWRTFLQWREYADQFQKPENQCQEEIMRAKEELVEAKKGLASKMPDEAEEISEDETEREETAKHAATRILGGLEHMSKSLSTLSAQAEKNHREEEERQNKRPRKSSPKDDIMEDAADVPLPAATGSLPPAMQPFHKPGQQ